MDSVTQPATVYKTFKYKLKPTPEQERTFEQWLHLCRQLYNAALEQRIAAWKRTRTRVSYNQQAQELKDIRAAMPEYADISSHVLQNVLARLDRTYQAFFRRLRQGERAGFPRFKCGTRYNSFTYKQVGSGGTYVDSGNLLLCKIGHVAVRWSRPLQGDPKTITIKREADGWYVYIVCADVPLTPLSSTGRDVGIDLGIESFAALSDGTFISNPRVHRVAEMSLRRAQRRITRRKKGSNRRTKAVKTFAKACLKVARQRADFHHKTALALVRQCDMICHENLQPGKIARKARPEANNEGPRRSRGVKQKIGLNKAIKDAGWSQFLGILSYKAAWAGRRVIAVPPHYTSQVCSCCGVIVPKSLKQRWHSCTECGTELHRDHNAAINILRLGRQSAAGQAVQALT